MIGTILVSYEGGMAKVYLPNGAQSPKLFADEVASWIELGGDWVRHALEPPPFVDDERVEAMRAEAEAEVEILGAEEADLLARMAEGT